MSVDFTEQETAAVVAALTAQLRTLGAVDRRRGEDWEVQLHDDMVKATERALRKMQRVYDAMWQRP